MNTREQMLRKHNERLAAQVRFLLEMMDSMAADHELLGSVACGFAWDLQVDDEETLYLWEYSAKRAEEAP